MSLDYVKNQRGLSFIEIGMKVENTYLKKTCIVKNGNSSGNLDILFDGEKKPQNCHPKWAIKYFDKDRKVIAEYGQ